jgi:enoyl-CoA hydratase/carnithine racemase
MSELVQVETEGEWTKRIRLNRPERANALDQEITLQLIEAVAECYIDSTKLAVLSGVGAHFCSGFDRTLSSRKSAAQMAMLGAHIEMLLQLIWSAPFVTVATVQGSAVGGGADIVVACDYRLAGPDAVLFFPGFKLMGVSLGNRRLAQVIGSSRAIDVISRSKRIDREQAVRWGLAIGMDTTGQFASYVDDLAQSLKALDKHAIAVLRKKIRGELLMRSPYQVCAAQ